jgi:hypothetical protein
MIRVGMLQAEGGGMPRTMMQVLISLKTLSVR